MTAYSGEIRTIPKGGCSSFTNFNTLGSTPVKPLNLKELKTEKRFSIPTAM
ncbi:MAG: hypothetical protein ACLVEJ_00700 [Parabacteroides sp.]